MNERFPVVMTFVLGLSCSGLIAPAPSLFAASVSDNGPRPNIVLIMTDDMSQIRVKMPPQSMFLLVRWVCG